MPVTARWLEPYPVLTDTPDVPRDVKALADRNEAILSANIPTRGTYSSGSSSTAGPIVIAHGLGSTPSQVILQQRVTQFSNLFFLTRSNADANGFVVTLSRYDGQTLAATAVLFDWIAYP